jgi:hypothetical protein
MPTDFPADNPVPKAVLCSKTLYGGYSCSDLSPEGSTFSAAVAQNLFVFRPNGPPHPEGHIAGCIACRPIRPKMAANNFRGTATAANWNVTHFECRVTLAPILISFSRSVVNVQPLTLLQTSNRRRRLAVSSIGPLPRVREIG